MLFLYVYSLLVRKGFYRMDDKNSNKENWVVNFINLPSERQIDFLFREALDDSLRKEVNETIKLKNKKNLEEL
jgi:hypothetical protein